MRAANSSSAGAPVVLAGPNGAGKTNLLDAISLLSPGRGLRGAKLGEHMRKGPCVPERSAVGGGGRRWRAADETYEIGTGLTLGPNGGERRQVRLNGAPAQSSADLGEVVQMIWLTPAMDRLFIESAGGRRRFLDRLVLGFDAGHARAATRYETAMRERARLLKYGPRDPAWLDGLENEMAEAGIAMAVSARRRPWSASIARWPSAAKRAHFPPRSWRSTARPMLARRTRRRDGLRERLGARAHPRRRSRPHHVSARI